MFEQTSSRAAETTANPFSAALAEEAREAGLRYSNDQQPGITRTLRRGKFTYVQPDGSFVKDQPTLVRIKHLVIPPAWRNVWICPYENGHIQAVGRDDRGRKQYRYHEDWRRQRDSNKFGRMMAFARALPQIRKRVARDLRLPGMPRDKALATVVALLEITLIRVGNDEYAKQNRSYGLTTMRNQHAKVAGHTIEFSFRGKGGKRHEISVRDPQLARVVRRCQELPGQELFGYEEADGTHRDVTSQDVNEYLRGITGEDFTAKDFRTWAGTVLAAIALRECKACEQQRQARKNIVKAVEAVAKMLGNTPAVCRKCYVHPEILDSYISGETIAVIRQRASARLRGSVHRLKPDEAAVVALLQRRLRGSKSRLTKVTALAARSKTRKAPRRRRAQHG